MARAARLEAMRAAPRLTQIRVERCHGDENDHGVVLRQLGEQIKVARDECVLGDDADWVAEPASTSRQLRVSFSFRPRVDNNPSHRSWRYTAAATW